MSQTVELSDESAALLKQQADAHGVTVDAWVQALAREKARLDDIHSGRQRAQAAAARILFFSPTKVYIFSSSNVHPLVLFSHCYPFLLHKSSSYGGLFMASLGMVNGLLDSMKWKCL